MLALSSLPGLSIETLHFEVRDVVLLDAHRRDLRDAAVERLVLERLDADPRRLAEAHAADVGLVHLAAHEHLVDVAERHDQRRVGAEVENRRDRAADFDVAASGRSRESARGSWRCASPRRRDRPRPSPAPPARCASVTLASLIASCDCAARLRFSARSTALWASSSADCAIRRCGEQRFARGRRRGARIRRPALPLRRCSS